VGTTPTFKRGSGFHPTFCVADATGEALAARLWSCNAAANTVSDRLAVLDVGRTAAAAVRVEGASLL
jgi:hypothetical protein